MGAGCRVVQGAGYSWVAYTWVTTLVLTWGPSVGPVMEPLTASVRQRTHEMTCFTRVCFSQAGAREHDVQHMHVESKTGDPFPGASRARAGLGA